MNDRNLITAIAAGACHLVIDHVAQGRDVRTRDANGVSLLQWCAYHGDVTALAFLCKHGAELSDLGYNLDLNGAIFHGHLRLVAWLIERGADVNAALPDTGETPLHAALCKANRPTYAAIIALLLDHGAAVNLATHPGAPTDSFMRAARTCAETPLHRAAGFASETVIDLLLAHGADKTALDMHGDSPLAWASWHLRPDAILRKLCFGPHHIDATRHSTYDHGSGWGHGEM